MTSPIATDWASVSREAAVRLLGPPNDKFSSNDELRWGEKGEFRLDLKSGFWQDFYSGETGGVFSLVEKKLTVERAEAVKWLQDENILQKSDTRPASQPRSAPRAQGTENIVTIAYNDSKIVEMDDNHPARRWASLHNVWPISLPFPKGARWLPADSSFYDSHQGAGSIVAVAAPLHLWQLTYPGPPPPMAVQLISLDDEGQPALDRPANYVNQRGETRPGLSKRNYGRSGDAVYCIGDPRTTKTNSVAVCEGLKDAMALAARLPVTVVAFFGAPGRLLAPTLARYKNVDLYPDIDAKGGEWATALAPAVAAYGATARICLVEGGTDPGDAGTALLDRDNQKVKDLARSLVAKGNTEHDAERLAYVKVGQDELRISPEHQDGIFAAERKVVEPDRALQLTTKVVQTLRLSKGRLSKEDTKLILETAFVIQASAQRLIDEDDRLFTRNLERTLLKGDAVPAEIVAQLETIARKGRRLQLSPVNSTALPWHIDDLWPKGTLAELKSASTALSLEAVVRLLLAAARKDRSAFYAIACFNSRSGVLAHALLPENRGTSHIESRYEQVRDRILCESLSEVAGLWNNGGLTQQGRLLLGECSRLDVKALVIDGAYDSCTTTNTEDRKAFCAAMREWCDQEGRSVILLLGPSSEPSGFAQLLLDTPEKELSYKSDMLIQASQSIVPVKSSLTISPDGTITYDSKV